MKKNLQLPIPISWFTGLFLTLFILNGFTARSTTKVYTFPNNLKDYATETITDASPPSSLETVMAGTIYNYGAPGKHVVHFMHLDQTGNILNSVYFDQSNYQELRVVDVVGNQAGANAIYYIIVMARPSTSESRVMIIPVNRNGVQVANTINVAALNEHLYPFNALYHTGNGSLYICGLWTKNTITPPGQPGYAGYGSNKGFILKVDPVQPNPLLAHVLINTNLPAGNTATDDYDIALRVERLVGMAPPKQIFVTGGVNSQKTPGNYYSATMNVVFDDNLNFSTAPSPMTNPYTAHFTNSPGYEFVEHEMGVSIIPDKQIFPNDGWLIVGNLFHRPNPSAGGFDPRNGFFTITHVDRDFRPLTGPSQRPRVRFGGFDYAWALQTLFTPQKPGPKSSFIIGGMTMNDWSCSGSMKHSFDSVGPFLFKGRTLWNGTDLVVTEVDNWTTYYTQNGTGPFAAPNGYYNLGGGLANAMFNPTFAVNNLANSFLMSAPHWDKVNNRLSLKYIQADQFFGDGLCFPGFRRNTSLPLGDPDIPPMPRVDACPHPGSLLNVFPPQPVQRLCFYPPGSNDITWDYAAISNPRVEFIRISDMRTGAYNVISTATCTTSPPDNYRENNTTGIAELQDRNATVIYPNPANTVLNISLHKSIAGEAEIQVIMADIQGRAVAELYRGKASGLTSNPAMQLPEIVPGVYVVQVVADGKQIHRQKISITP